MRSRIRLLRAATVAALAIAALGAARADEPALDAKAKPLYDEMMAAYRGLKQYHATVNLNSVQQPAGVLDKNAGPAQFEIRMERPNRLWYSATVTRDGKPHRALLVCDGTNLFRWDGDTNRYTKTAAPADLRDMYELPLDLFDARTLFLGKSPLSGLEPSGLTFSRGKSGKVGNVPVDLLQAEAPMPNVHGKIVYRLQVGKVDRLLHGVAMELSGGPVKGNTPLSVKTTLQYTLVDPDPRFSDSDFLFMPPAGATEAK